ARTCRATGSTASPASSRSPKMIPWPHDPAVFAFHGAFLARAGDLDRPYHHLYLGGGWLGGGAAVDLFPIDRGRDVCLPPFHPRQARGHGRPAQPAARRLIGK